MNPVLGEQGAVIVIDVNAMGGGGGAFNLEGNTPPELSVDGEKTRSVAVGEPVSLTAFASDDGIPKRRPLMNSGT